MDTDTSTAKAGGKKPLDDCVNMETETASELEDLSHGHTRENLEEASTLAPLEFELGGGTSRERLGELNLAQFSNYRCCRLPQFLLT